MKPEDVLKKYGSKYRFQKETGISRAALIAWLHKGYIPEGSQYKLEVLTKGELKTDWSVDEQK